MLNTTLGMSGLNDNGNAYKVFGVYAPVDYTTLLEVSMRSQLKQVSEVQAALDYLQEKVCNKKKPFFYEAQMR
jgi:hypothetical protein